MGRWIVGLGILAVLVAGSAMNFIVAVLVFSAAYATGWPDASVAPIEIGGTASDSPAQSAGDIRPRLALALISRISRISPQQM